MIALSLLIHPSLGGGRRFPPRPVAISVVSEPSPIRRRRPLAPSASPTVRRADGPGSRRAAPADDAAGEAGGLRGRKPRRSRPRATRGPGRRGRVRPSEPGIRRRSRPPVGSDRIHPTDPILSCPSHSPTDQRLEGGIDRSGARPPGPLRSLRDTVGERVSVDGSLALHRGQGVKPQHSAGHRSLGGSGGHSVGF